MCEERRTSLSGSSGMQVLLQSLLVPQHRLPLSMTGWSLECIGSNTSSFPSSLQPPSSCLRCGTAPNQEQLQEWELEPCMLGAAAPRAPGGIGCSGALSLPLPLTSFEAMCNDREDLSHILNAITLHDARPDPHSWRYFGHNHRPLSQKPFNTTQGW